MTECRVLWVVAAIGLALAAPLMAQDEPGAELEPVVGARADWLSDGRAIRMGEILTVLLDERTVARERISRVATADRSQRAGLLAELDGKSAVGSSSIDARLDQESRNVGESNRQGDLVGVVSVQVVELLPGGIARIEGRKMTRIDGRDQKVIVKGLVRPEDIGPGNRVFSSRIADGEITYEGKEINPRRSLLGRILSFFWP